MPSRITNPPKLVSRIGGRTVAFAFALALSAAALPARAGTWTKGPKTVSGGPAFGLWMMTDGRVLSHNGAYYQWMMLTPDKTGSYITGTWKSVASSAFARGGATEHVLKDGRFLEAGGEYIYVWPDHDGIAACTHAAGQNCANQPDNTQQALFKNVEIYDPVANTWTIEADGLSDIGDTGSANLADGRLLYSTRSNNTTQIYDPSTNTWTAGPSMPIGSGDENAWAALQNGNVFAVGYMTAGCAVYNPSTNKWTKVPAFSGFNTGDTGGISLTFDGRVYIYGLTGHSYIYTPGASATDAGTLSAGPTLITTNGATEAEDEYSDTLPNGMVFGGLVAKMFGAGVALQQFDPTTNTVSSVTPENETTPYPIDYVNLPNGQVMITPGSGNSNYIYTPDGAPQDAWRPTVTSVVFNSSANTYTLTGTQISGLINGADEGDDMTMAQNFPVIWMTDSANNVYYARSYNFSNMMPSVGSTPETADFTLPAGMAAGSYNLYVSAVGVQSKNPFPFTVGQSTTTGAGGTSGGSTGGTTGGTGGATGTGGVSGTGGAGTGGVTGGSTGGTTGGSTGGTTGGSTGGTTGGGTGGSTTVGTGGSTGAGTGGSTGAGTGGSTGTGTGGSTGETGGSGGPGDTGAQSGCSCDTAAVSSSSLLGLGMLLVGLGGILRRRRYTAATARRRAQLG
jgi:MYXO-CTERM domain-containing protein